MNFVFSLLFSQETAVIDDPLHLPTTWQGQSETSHSWTTTGVAVSWSCDVRARAPCDAACEATPCVGISISSLGCRCRWDRSAATTYGIDFHCLSSFLPKSFIKRSLSSISRVSRSRASDSADVVTLQTSSEGHSQSRARVKSTQARRQTTNNA